MLYLLHENALGSALLEQLHTKKFFFFGRFDLNFHQYFPFVLAYSSTSLTAKIRLNDNEHLRWVYTYHFIIDVYTIHTRGRT